MSIKYVEYLEADGNSYFELPAGTITWNNNSGIEVQYYHNAYVGSSYLIGAYGQNGNSAISTYYEQLSILMFEQKFTKSWYTNDYTADIQPYAHTIKIDKNGRIFDGVTESITWSEPESWIFERINLSPVRIFGQGSNQGDNYKYVALQGTRIYYVKIYNGDEVVHYFRPCLKGNTPCIYDEISQTFYYNQGTGTFGYGKALNTLHLFANNNQGTAENLGNYRLYNMKIEGDSEGVESGVNYVDCLIGDGASYIDTGIVVRNGYTIDLTFASTIDRYNQEPICGSGDVVGYTYDRFGGYGIGLRSYFVAVREIRDEANTDKNELETTTVTFAINEKVNFSHKFTNVNNNGSCLVMGQNYCDNSNPVSPLYKTSNTVKLYDFKIYDDNDTLLMHLKPCLDTEGIPCMYDEVSGEYFENLGTGTFGYKKELRDFQPVLDSNGVPCLMDKINKKYYYDKNGKGFGCDRYSGVSYLKGDGNSWIDTGLKANKIHGYRIEIKFINATDKTNANLGYQQMLFGSSEGGLDRAEMNCHIRYDWYLKSQGLTHLGSVDLDKNGVVIETTFTVNTPTSSYSIFLFGTNGKNTNSDNHNACDATIYYWKVYDTNNNLIQHLIPAIDTNGSIGMYDLVTETFFYNQGTGEFSYGIEESECPPANYVEYIRGSRNAYINTLDISGMINSEVEVEWKFKLEAISKATGWFGTVGGYNTTPLYARNGYNNTLGNAINVVFLEPSNNVTIKTEDRHLGVHVMKINKTGLYMDGNLEAELPGTTYYDSYGFVQPFALLGYNYWNGIQSRFWENVLYYVTVKQAGELILDFRPCLDDNGVLCVYEAVNGVYYYNSDTGEFGGHGKSIGYTPIKYIETNGTQYIDTGVVPTDNTDIDMVARAIDKPYFQVGWKNAVDLFPNPNVEYILETDIKYLGKQQGYGAVIQTHSWAKFLGITAEGYYQIYDTISTTLASTTSYDKIKINITNSAILLYVNDKLTLEVANSSIFGALLGGGSSNWALFRTHGVKATSLDGEVLYNCIPVLADTDITLSGNTTTIQGLPRIYEEINGTYAKINYPDNLNYQESGGRPNWDYGYDDSYLCNNMTLINTYKQVPYTNSAGGSSTYTIYDKSVYGYKETNTNVEPNLTASEGATLTLGSTYMSYLSEEELEQATKNGWIIE